MNAFGVPIGVRGEPSQLAVSDTGFHSLDPQGRSTNTDWSRIRSASVRIGDVAFIAVESAPRPTTYVVRHPACRPDGLPQPQSPFRAFVRGLSPPRGGEALGAARRLFLMSLVPRREST